MTPAKTIATKVAPVRVLIADDDPLVRAAVGVLLPAEGFKLAGEARDGGEAIDQVKALRPDLLLLDLNMPNKAGLEALRELSGAGVRTIVLTVAIEKRQILEALQLGARGIVLKAAARTLLADAINSVIAGHYWINDQPLQDVQAVIRDLTSSVAEAPAAPKTKLLSPKELQIVCFIVEGRTNKDIAQELQTSEQVIKNHLGKIFDKLGVFNRLELALYAIDNRMVERQ